MGFSGGPCAIICLSFGINMDKCCKYFRIVCLTVILCCGGCGKVGFDELAPVVRDNLVLFGETEIPGELQGVLGSSNIITLGETCYVQEHHVYVARLFEFLADEGFTFFNEFPHAYSWMVEDYIIGEIQHIPYYIRLYNQVWVEKLREINLAQGPPYPVHLFFMDVNHNLDDFKTSIIESEKILGQQQIFALIKILKVDGTAYYNELLSLKESLEDESGGYLDTWGSKWYYRYLELIDMEIESHLYRTGDSEEKREEFMRGIIESKKLQHPGLKTMVNCGMDHAQKETMMGTRITRIGAMLEEDHPGETCSIAFVGISGKRKYSDDETETINFNTLESAGKDDIIRIIGEEAGSSMGFLKLEHKIFREEMDATYTAGAVRVAPGRQFDAIISYPVITVLESLSDFTI